MRALILIAAAMAAPVPTSAVPAAGASLTVEVSGVPSAQGSVHVDLCTEKTFITSDCPYTARAPSVPGTTVVTFAHVPPGRYAAQAFHDRDNSGKINRNFLGIPTERVGFSNDAPVHFAPPKFRDAVFEHGEAPQRIAFKVRSLP